MEVSRVWFLYVTLGQHRSQNMRKPFFGSYTNFLGWIKRYQNLSEGGKNKKQEYDCKRCKSLPGVKKQRIVGYRKNIIYNIIKVLKKKAAS